MGNWMQLFNQIGEQINNLERSVSASSDTGFPIRENLLQDALIAFPLETPVAKRLMQNSLPGAGSAVAWREITGFNKIGSVFYTEGGTPGDAKYTFVPRTAGYKLLGRRFGVTGFARAVGASFQDALVRDRAGALDALKDDIEDAIFNADENVNPLAFDGLIKQIDVANGSYVDAINGALALSDLTTALRESWDRGYTIDWIGVSGLQAEQINDLVLTAGVHEITVIRSEQGTIAGKARVSGIVHPVTGQIVDLIPSRKLAAGTIIGVPEKSPTQVEGRQGNRALWWDSLLDITEVEEGVSGDTFTFFLKTYATMAFPGRRGAFKLTGIM